MSELLKPPFEVRPEPSGYVDDDGAMHDGTVYVINLTDDIELSFGDKKTATQLCRELNRAFGPQPTDKELARGIVDAMKDIPYAVPGVVPGSEEAERVKNYNAGLRKALSILARRRDREAKYEEALREIVDHKIKLRGEFRCAGEPPHSGCDDCDWMQEIARAALEGKEVENG